MKKILLLFFIFLSLNSSFSQDINTKFYITGGYTFNFPNASSVNFIIDRYNNTRNYLTKKMDNINTLSGTDFSAGAILDLDESAMLIEGGVTFKNSGTKYAEGTVSGENFQRDFKVYNFLVDIGFGYLFNYNKPLDYGIGMFVDFGSFTYDTRIYKTNETPPDYTDISPANSSALSFTPVAFLNINLNDHFGISVRPYYFAQILSMDLTDVHTALNPNTWQNDNASEYNSETFSGFGVDLKGVISF